MADENNTADAPVEEAITPEPTSEAQATEQVQPQESQQTEPKYVTQEDLEGFATDILRRAKQSDRDRNKQINDELTKIKGVLEKSGAPLSEEKEAALRNTITDQIDAEDEPQPRGQSAAPPQADPVGAFLGGIFAEAGETVTENDPEWKALKKVMDDNFNNPNGLPKILVAATNAANAKKERKTSLQETATARVGGGGSSANNTGASDLSPTDKISRGLKEASWTQAPPNQEGGPRPG